MYLISLIYSRLYLLFPRRIRSVIPQKAVSINEIHSRALRPSPVFTGLVPVALFTLARRVEEEDGVFVACTVGRLVGVRVGVLDGVRDGVSFPVPLSSPSSDPSPPSPGGM